ncbi:hypothetical protein [Lactococcus garvieae]|uniref:hypothetical protein n=1 Tax=Lactococcus garvieae TaxID=1363 RepID=UPI0018D830F3|nr:hypothetical protein [Lactococcus garvieae]QPS71430.1 hypothetical protein I6G50_01860 [Lactococcus garvieae]
MIYKATLGGKYSIDNFIDKVELRFDHELILPADVYKLDWNTVIVDTKLQFPVNQPVSMGGYPTGSIGGKSFRLLEVSITNYPVFDNSMITEIIYHDDDKNKPTIESILDGSYLSVVAEPKKYELMVIEQPKFNKGE